MSTSTRESLAGTRRRAAGGTLTPVWIRIGVVQLESHPLDEVAQVICTSDDIRVRRRRSTAYGDRPAVGMVGTRERLLLLRGQDPRRVSIDNRTVYRHSLVSRNQRRNVGSSREGRRTRTRTRSLEAMTVEGRGRGESRRLGRLRLRLASRAAASSPSTTSSTPTPLPAAAKMIGALTNSQS